MFVKCVSCIPCCAILMYVSETCLDNFFFLFFSSCTLLLFFFFCISGWYLTSKCSESSEVDLPKQTIFAKIFDKKVTFEQTVISVVNDYVFGVECAASFWFLVKLGACSQ